MILDPAHLKDHVLFGYNERGFQPNSYDLQTRVIYEICGGVTLYADGSKELPEYKEVESVDGFFILKPDILYQVEAYETVKMPHSICGISIMRSSMAKSGASGEIGLYDSGYQGSLGMTVKVKHECRIQEGASIAQVLFFGAWTSHLYEGEYLNTDWRKIIPNVSN